MSIWWESVCVCVYIYIYIYIYRERERERERENFNYTHASRYSIKGLWEKVQWVPWRQLYVTACAYDKGGQTSSLKTSSLQISFLKTYPVMLLSCWITFIFNNFCLSCVPSHFGFFFCVSLFLGCTFWNCHSFPVHSEFVDLSRNVWMLREDGGRRVVLDTRDQNAPGRQNLHIRVSRNISVKPAVWSTDMHLQHHLGTCKKCRFSGLVQNLLIRIQDDLYAH